MEKEFVPYELALRMKQLGFDEPCFAYYYTLNGRDWKFAEKTEYYKLDDNMNIGGKFTISAPLIQQAFKWFREKYGYWSYIKEATKGTCRFYIEKFDEKFFNSDIIDSYEEAELECLKKLIEIIKQK
jgi:hypothetical protein